MITNLTFWRRLRRDRDGVTAVEFALVAPVVVTAFLLILEISSMLLAQGLLEISAARGARLGSTGTTASGASMQQTIYGEMARLSLGTFFDTDKIVFEPTVYPNWEAVDGTPDPASVGQYGGAGEIVVYAFHYDWKGLTPLFTSVLGDDAKVVLNATVTVRNEPFAS